MEITEHGLIKPANDDFYNIDDFNNNTDVLERHLDDDEIHVTSEQRSGWNNKLPLTGGTMTGSLVHNRIDGVKHYTDVFHYSNDSTTSLVGTLKIKLPKGYNDTMLQMKISGFSSSAYRGEWELDLGGQLVNSSQIWTLMIAKLNGSNAPFTSVRVAKDSDGLPCLLIGVTTTVWLKPRIIITDFIASYADVDGWDTGWSASFITDESSLLLVGTSNLKTPFSSEDLVTNLLAKVYPVGSIYMSVTNTSPATFLGGIWSMIGEGQVLMSANPSGSTYTASNATGGSATTSLSTANLPSHTHSFSGSATPSGSISNSVSCDQQGNHYHGAGALYATNTGIGGTANNFATDMNHNIYADGVFNKNYSTASYVNTPTVGNTADGFYMNASHSHDVEGTTDWGGTHAHNIGVSSSFSGNSLTISGTTGAQGSGTAFSNLQPYLTTYMWKRTA